MSRFIFESGFWEAPVHPAHALSSTIHDCIMYDCLQTGERFYARSIPLIHHNALGCLDFSILCAQARGIVRMVPR